MNSSRSDSTEPVVSSESVDPSKSAGDDSPVVLILGNPNAGKSTIFNRLTGLKQKIANYPGVTVEKKEGRVQTPRHSIRLVDLPGTYSLSAHSPDEIVAVDVLLGRGGLLGQEKERRPDLVVQVVDASNLERNLYLYSQLQELGLRTVVVLNMVDVAEASTRAVDAALLSERLGVPVVSTEAHKGRGLDKVLELIDEGLAGSPVEASELPYPAAFRDLVDESQGKLDQLAKKAKLEGPHSFEVLRALVDAGGRMEARWTERFGGSARQILTEARSSFDGHLPAVEAEARYAWVRDRIGEVRAAADIPEVALSERIDRVLTHRVFGLAIFVLAMVVVFQSIFTWASPLMDLIDSSFGSLSAWVASHMEEGMLQSLVCDGLIAGVGGVIIFLPQILILFLFIGLLEDCGYMARAAFLMDNVMSRCGLSGKSFIPMMSGFACAIPAVMATRVIEDRRDRLTTILVAPLMSCSARLPVYIIFTETFVPDDPVLGSWLGLQALTMLGLYVLGVVFAIIVARLLKSTLLKGATPPFLLELPGYKLPSAQSVAIQLVDRGKAFLVRAGTLILAISVIVWALLYFPRPDTIAAQFDAQRDLAAAELSEDELADRISEIDAEENGAYIRQSYFGRMGHFVEPVFRPLGWDWRISMASLASFPAREVIVATLGTIYNVGDEADEESQSLRDRLKEATWDGTDRLVFNVPVALSIMVFFALCCQCGATLATIRRETNSWNWAIFTFVYMTALAYVVAFAVYQIGSSWS